MFNLNKVHKQYEKYREYDEQYLNFKRLLQELYTNNKNELIKEQEEYFSLDFTSNAPKEYLNSHNILVSYLEYKKEKEKYESEKKKIKNNNDLINNNEQVVLVKNEDTYVFYDLVTDENVSCKDVSEREIMFIKSLLEKANSFIDEIDYKDLNLMKNIVSDIKYKNGNGTFTNNEIKNEFRKAKNNSYILRNSKEKQNILNDIKKLKEANDKLIASHNISYDDYVVNLYAYYIVQGEDIEKMYLAANDDEKRQILKAYILLSSYEHQDVYNRHIRLESRLINGEVYLENKKSAIK